MPPCLLATLRPAIWKICCRRACRWKVWKQKEQENCKWLRFLNAWTCAPIFLTSNLGWTNFNYIKWFWENSLPILLNHRTWALWSVWSLEIETWKRFNQRLKRRPEFFGEHFFPQNPASSALSLCRVGMKFSKTLELALKEGWPRMAREVWCGRVEFWVSCH